MTDHLIIMSPNSAASLPEIVRTSQKLGADIGFAFAKHVAFSNPRLVRIAELLAPTYILSSSNGLPVGVGSVTTFADDQLEFRDLLSSRIRGFRSFEVSPWDKLHQRQLFYARGLSRLRSLPIDRIEDLGPAISKIGFPAVLKPRRSFGGSRMKFLSGPADLQDVAKSNQPLVEMMVEQRHGVVGESMHSSRIRADFVSVETVSVGGRRKVVAVFDKLPVHLDIKHGEPFDSVLVCGDIYPSAVSNDCLLAVASLVESALDALGVGDGMTHTEVRLTDLEPEIIEVNGRLGGDLARVSAQAGGPDLVALAMSADSGAPLDLDDARSQVSLAAGLYPCFASGVGTVASNVSRADLLRLPGVVRVDHVAAKGVERSHGRRRAADVVVGAASARSLDRKIAQVGSAVSDLFSQDELAPSDWFRSCRDLLEAAN